MKKRYVDDNLSDIEEKSAKWRIDIQGAPDVSEIKFVRIVESG